MIAGLVGAGVASIAAGLAARTYGRNRVLRSAGAVVGIGGLVPLALGLSMVAYAAGAKLRLRDWMLARRAWRGDEMVLDVGAGRGLMAIGAAKLVPHGRVVAVDIWRDEDLSGNGPAALRENAVAEGVAERIEIVTGDARSLDLPDASVDVVLSVLCIHNIEPADERVAACREIARVLRPGGVALIADYTGTRDYARIFREAGLIVRGPINAQRQAIGLMALVEAEKSIRPL